MRTTQIFIFVSLALALIGCKTNSSSQNAAINSQPATSPVAVMAQPSTPSSPGASPMSSPSSTTVTPDLSLDAQGLSKAVAVITTEKGVIKFRFYPKDAPNTVNRII